MRIVRFDERRATPWRNGGGATTELVVFPEGAGFDDFEWRISVADVVDEGPFSRFEGADRILTLASGGGLELTVDGAVARLDAESPPFAFPGEAEVYGRPMSGPVRDINVMTRRGLWRANGARLPDQPASPVAGATAIVVALAACEIEVGMRRVGLAPFDALFPAPGERIGGSKALLVSLERIVA